MANCSDPGECRSPRRLATARCLWFPPHFWHAAGTIVSMHLAAGILYAVAAVCELARVALVVDLALKLGLMLRTGALTRLDGGDASGRKAQPDLADVLVVLAKNAARPWIASIFIVVGILAGTASNFLTLCDGLLILA
jgi:hypothetical protein